tara:strand:+ start:116 stop:793 length:678 start_codon:yes stop_codon:yes gene_type:complete
MKLIMENWNNFLSENKKKDIKNLKFGEIKDRSFKKQLSQSPKVIDIRMSDLPISKFPDNDSETTRQELKKVLNAMTTNTEMDRDELREADKKPLRMFFKYLDSEGLDYDKDLLKEIYSDVSLITLKLKVRYDRPRPEQLGHLVGYDVKSIKTDSDDSPSFPSGHTAQAWTMAYYLSDKHSDHQQSFFDIAEKIEKSRIIRGAHFPSDNKEAKKIAKKYLYPNIKD